MKKFFKIFFLVILSIIGFVVVTLGTFNIVKFAIYGEYYFSRSNVCNNPGLRDGFVCQGIAYVESEEKILVSGYMANKSASRIYVTNVNNESHYVSLKKPNGKDFKGHSGGITCVGDTVYVASDDSLNPFSLTEILSAKNGDVVTMSANPIPVHNQASFVFSDDDYLYVGEFHDGGAYVTDHIYGDNHAIIERIPITTLLTTGQAIPDKVYSIRDKVQGLCVTPDGKMIMSTSFGLADSHYYVYDEAAATPIAGETFEGAQVYQMGDCLRDLKGPAMAEGLAYMDGKVITLTESASNKYIFGKFFFANKIVAIQF